MNTTPITLLERLRRPTEQKAWSDFVRLYTPLIFYWSRRMGLQRQDAADLVQEVLTVLVQKLPEFAYEHHGSFRGWLRTITMNKWRDSLKRRRLPMADGDDAVLAEVADAKRDELFEEKEYRRYLVNRAMHLMKADFQPTTWRACWEHIVSGRSADEVAEELNITVGAVYAAKYRVLNRLRQGLTGLIEE